MHKCILVIHWCIIFYHILLIFTGNEFLLTRLKFSTHNRMYIAKSLLSFLEKWLKEIVYPVKIQHRIQTHFLFHERWYKTTLGYHFVNATTMYIWESHCPLGCALRTRTFKIYVIGAMTKIITLNRMLEQLKKDT